MSEYERWDPSRPEFLTTILWVLVVLWLLVSGIGSLLYPASASGLLTGGFTSIIAYGSALMAGRTFAMTQRYAATMFWLFVLQGGIALNIFLWIVVMQVSAVGFAIGASIMPVGIVLTAIWYFVKRRGWHQ